jgi:transposase
VSEPRRRRPLGQSSERLEQLELLIGALEEETAEQEARQDAAVARRPSQSDERRPRGRQPLPAHLPRERVEHEATCVCPACGSKKLSRIGSDEREVLEYVPVALQGGGPRPAQDELPAVRNHHPGTAPVVTDRARPAGPQSPRPCPGGQVLRPCAPLYRQSAIYARAGVELERSTLVD